MMHVALHLLFAPHTQAVVEKALEPVRDWRQFKAWMALQPPKEKVTGEASGYRSTLVMAGLAVCDDDIPPASPSLHESALYQQPVSLQLPALDETRLKLGRDRLYMASKYGGSLQASMERARFFVELPESPQHRKFCYETKVDTSRSEIAKQVAQARPKITQSRRLKLHAVARVQEVEEAKEEERKIARRNSLMKIKEGGLSPLMMAQERRGGPLTRGETADPSRRYRIVEKVIKRNRMPEDILEEVWEKIEEAPATVSSRSIALVLMQRVVAASNCPASLEGPLFNFIRNKHKEFVKERPGLSMNQDSRHSHMWLSWTPGAWNSLTLYPRSHSIRCIASLYPRSASPGDLDPRLPRPTDRACGSKSETATPATTGTRNRRALWSSAAFAVYCSSTPIWRSPPGARRRSPGSLRTSALPTERLPPKKAAAPDWRGMDGGATACL
eukprot:g27033.t1